MFAEVEFEWTVLVQPDAMKSSVHIQRAVILALLKDFDDVKCSAQHGYHVVLTTLENIGEGRLWERRGCAAFPVRFRCLVFNVFKNEHVLAVVTEAQSSGILCQCGPIELLFISKKHMTQYEFLSTDVDFVAVTEWRNTRDGTSIKKGDAIRVKILGTKWEPAQRAMSAAGSLLGDYAGVDDRCPELKDMHKSAGATDDGGWGESPSRGANDPGGWGESPARGGTDTGGWGESPLRGEANDTGGWGDPTRSSTNDDGGWGDPPPDAADHSGWGELRAEDAGGKKGWGDLPEREDDSGPSGWD